MFYIFNVSILGVLSIVELLTNITSKKFYKKFINYLYIYMWILLVFNRNNNDYDAYYDMFYHLEKYNVELGYLFLMKLIKIINGNYNIILLIVMSYLVLLISRLKIKYKITLIFMYFLYNINYDVTQIRNTIAILLIMTGINLSKYSNKFSIICNLLALSVHNISLIYFPFFFLYKIKINKYINIIKIVMILNFIILIILLHQKNLLIYIFPKLDYYFKFKINKGWLLYFIYFGIDWFYYKVILKSNSSKYTIYLKFWLFSYLFIPFSILNTEFISSNA